MKEPMNYQVDLETLKQRADKLDGENPEIMMMSAVDCVVQLAEDSGFSEDFLTIADKYVNYLAERQGITKIQAVFLALFVERSASGTRASLSEIAEYMGCSNVKVLRYQTEIDGLVKKGLLRTCKMEGMEKKVYFTPNEVFLSAIDDKPYSRPSYTNCSFLKFIQTFYDIVLLRKKGELSTMLMAEEVKRLFDENEDLHYVKSLRRYHLSMMDEIVVTQFCRYLVLSKKNSIPFSGIALLIDRPHAKFNLLQSFQDGTNPLIKKGLVEMASNDSLNDEEEYALTDIARQRLLKGFETKNPCDGSYQVIDHKKIALKKMFFDARVTENLERLSNLLSDKKYKLICKRLNEKGMRQGFTSLFYGAPGTGKTESVLQLARQSGRDVLQVNISEVKSMWVGESEKNIKAIFERYRTLLKHTRRAPILLFNEADAILGKRNHHVAHSADKMENSIQNIILQEMETMNGIMIATTNLEENLDKAFERRFLYKIKFEKPSIAQRRAMWKSSLPKLSNEEIGQIASSYDFTGGQIENVVRKCSIDSVLYGDDSVDVDRIRLYCYEETLDSRRMTKIGFK